MEGGKAEEAKEETKVNAQANSIALEEVGEGAV
jgi:hypothetical protein